jgi:predicted Zn-dependent protease
VLRTTWNDTIEPGSLETANVNGLPVALARSRGKEWSFRLSAIRMGDTTYRLILAVRAGGGDLESLFRRTLETVRPVTPEETRTIHPLRIEIVTAKDGDTLEALADRMAVRDRPVERFQILNGLDRTAPVAPGERYKIVRE